MTAIYYAFIAGIAAGAVLTTGALALMALRTLGEESIEDEG